MALSTPKTLMDFFQLAKRLKASPSSSSSFPAVSVAGRSRDLGSVANSPPRVTVTTAVADDSSGLTPEQVTRAEFHKFVAKSKSNLAVCSVKYLIFNALNTTHFDQVKTVIIGLDMYII
ncbi:unnamed protein product [Arabidopsis thaliana]|uniref:(thale cress) hypothetical protein n=1 Tax=Arabidopsis thaliana TaxID=3702 RepID=A0A7G2E5W2_ARATH|nr:unnamed protein product [Arabidopsis thaliana]